MKGIRRRGSSPPAAQEKGERQLGFQAAAAHSGGGRRIPRLPPPQLNCASAAAAGDFSSLSINAGLAAGLRGPVPSAAAALPWCMGRACTRAVGSWGLTAARTTRAGRRGPRRRCRCRTPPCLEGRGGEAPDVSRAWRAADQTSESLASDGGCSGKGWAAQLLHAMQAARRTCAPLLLAPRLDLPLYVGHRQQPHLLHLQG